MTERHATPASLWGRLVRAALRPTDGAWLAAFRVLFGLTMLTSMVRFIAYGWIDAFFVKPTFHFKYWGFSWVETLPGPYMHGLFWGLGVAALCVTLGLFYRVAAWSFALGFAYLLLLDVTTYLNHYYLAFILAVLLALSPAHRLWSLDALRLRRAGSDTREWVPRGWLYLFRFQIGVVYTFAGLAKAQGDWLVHAQPLDIWLSSRTGLPVLGPLFTIDGAAHVMSWAGFLFDTSIPWLLLVPRIRPWAYALVVLFHATTHALFPIGMFPVIMVLGALVFFPESWPRRWVKGAAPGPLRPVSGGQAVSRLAYAAIAAGLLHAAVQVAMPLRHVLYPGAVIWHEQGMRWSWRVMVREKNGSVTYHVRDPATGNTWEVSPRRYLTRNQERDMSSQPDLILQLAHHVRDEFQERVGGPVEVRAEALVSLNGRRHAMLLDPKVDLGRVEDGVGRALWITPEPRGDPPELRPVVSGGAVAASRHSRASRLTQPVFASGLPGKRQ